MLDFTELSDDGQDLELLVRELLFSIGYKVYWSGRGPDGGRDLVCIEDAQSIFMQTSKKWLIQCKHKAKSGNSVGVGDLDDIITSCIQHECDGYVLVTSTYPSSGVASRLEQITKNDKTPVVASYWDSVELERRLRTAQQWNIAQRFFPRSAEGWQIFASERPNHWTANFKGYYFHLTNRIGSSCQMYLKDIEEKLEYLESHTLPDKHFMRLRSVYFDDKHGTFVWYVDYMHPNTEKLDCNSEQLEEFLSQEWNDTFDVKIRGYLEYSDHYDPDHYDFYDRYMGQFILGMYRPR
ncbi:restriction endonuclease [Pseudomonas rhodesiae]|uniref:restriction endonuclease n=1 Tax=Pseudomonas rhodesiae TaxID=76760 RepID=UPI001BCD5F1F|nr:restriction endonuclease [Pseudomonas rhodesiae]QVM99619.1 restriction endonuclease [Pseudomonas rhodesiae]